MRSRSSLSAFTLVLLCASSARAELRIPVIALASGQTADVVTSSLAFSRGCIEANGLYGSRPSVGRLMAVKALAVGPAIVAMWFAERSGHGRWATFLGFVGGGIGTGAAMSNAMQFCGGGR